MVVVLHDEQAFDHIAAQFDQLLGGRPLGGTDGELRCLLARLLGQPGDIEGARDEEQAVRPGTEHVVDDLGEIGVGTRFVGNGDEHFSAASDGGLAELG